MKKKAPAGYVNPHAHTNIEDLPRLKRLIGQLEGVRKMVEDKRHCYEVVHQLRAVASAIQGLEAKILNNHVEHLIEEVIDHPHSPQAEHKKKDLRNLLKGKLFI
jgi:DNA-binding FrmR family transcriptional regulator